MASLFIVATPIGNLADLTFRAVEVLKGVEVVACEDTRHSQKLLTHYGLRKRLISCRSHNQAASAEGIIKLLREGRDIAYLTDAGTPALSDPGALLVKAVRDAGFTVVPIPGPSALATLLSVAGPAGKALTFDGFQSPKAGRRRTRLKELLAREEAFVLYESPHRVLKLLAELADLEPERHVMIGREMTKEHEEFLEGTPTDLLTTLSARQAVRGEFSVLVWGRKKR